MADDFGTADYSEDGRITLTEEDGTTHEFHLLELLQVNGKDYAVLLPLDPCDPEDDEAVILRVEEENGEEVLSEIGDEAEFDAVAAAWDELMAEEDEEEDEDEDEEAGGEIQ